MTCGKTLTARRAILLAGLMLAALKASPALAADAAVVVKPAEVVGWYFNGDVEVGGRAFIERPPSGFGRAPAPDNWLTPRTTDSRAKFEEYGERPPGFFVDHVWLGAGTRDGIYSVDIWATAIGFNNQSYYASLVKVGEHYLSVGWDQTPHLISTSAKTIYQGVGTTNLTIDNALQANLQANSQNATASGAAGVTARTNIEGFINNAERSLTLETRRDKASGEYRYAPDGNWEFKVDYSNEHRTGTRPLSMNWGSGFGATPGFPTNFVETIRPIDDRTQNVNAMLQYAGNTPWGKRWVSNVKYSGSFYDNSLKYYDADNPFCLTCLTGAGAGARGPDILRMSLEPSNMANAVTWTNAVDMPWQGRYTGTVQYNMMRQNDPFVNTATNGLVPAPLPETSANAQINTLLVNNVLTTQVSKDVKWTLRYRFYDVDNRTPEVLFTNYVQADSSISASSRRNLAIAYTKQNASSEVTWRPLNWINVGAFYGWEQYDRTRREANVTNEHTGKVFADADLWLDMKARASVAYSTRRYNTYDVTAFVDDIGINFSENLTAMRKFDMANRDRFKIEAFLDVPLDAYVVVTPTLGFRDDRYPVDVVNQLGLSKDTGWNVGVDASARLGQTLKVGAGYNYEIRARTMTDCCGGAAGGFTPANTWGSDVNQRYHTLTASLDWKAIPNTLDFRLLYLLALGSEFNDTAPCASGQAGCTGTGTGVTTTQFPAERNSFQRFSAIANYNVDPDFVRQMGWLGSVVVRLRYTYERNHTENWAIDNMTPYLPSPDQTADLTGGGRSLFLAAFNPNYTAQIIAASVAFKW
jgi:MtrB/PioB family decaheme-associated outer membrane protein